MFRCGIAQGYHDLQNAGKKARENFILRTRSLLSAEQNESRRQNFLNSMDYTITIEAHKLREKLMGQFGGKEQVKPTNENETKLKEAFADTTQLLHDRSWAFISDLGENLIQQLDVLAKNSWDTFSVAANEIFNNTMEGFQQTTPAIQFPNYVVQAPRVNRAVPRRSFESLIKNVPVGVPRRVRPYVFGLPSSRQPNMSYYSSICLKPCIIIIMNFARSPKFHMQSSWRCLKRYASCSISNISSSKT